MTGAAAWLPYVYGALGGAGILLVYYGLRRVTAAGRSDRERRLGLWMVNLGVFACAGSMALVIWKG